MWASQGLDLPGVLHEFQSMFNCDSRVEKLTRNWDRFVLLDSTDTGEKWALVVRDRQITDVQQVEANGYDEDADDLVHLQADEDVLKDIFSGRYDPARALVDGSLAVFSQDRDKVKLEAIAFVMWKKKLS